MNRQLILEDGTVLIGKGFGSEVTRDGEVVFTTGMTGYQETLSDRSFCGQMIVFTYPLIGNYGVNADDFEAINPALHGIIVKQMCDAPSNFRSKKTLDELLKEKDIPGLEGIDTRKLTRIIREQGVMKGRICGLDACARTVALELQQMQLPTDQVKQVSIQAPYSIPGRGQRIVLVDFGMKRSIVRELHKRDCEIIVVPYHTTASEILKRNPDGIMLSNGPGDPKHVPEAIQMIQEVLGKVPLFGICLGHQLFALACGANTEKMKYGHRGMNHPVKHLVTGKIDITSQNHGYTVDRSSIAKTELEISHVALNDGTIEGLQHRTFPAFTVQYHPEASPGPRDANHLFDQFLAMVVRRRTCQNVQI